MCFPEKNVFPQVSTSVPHVFPVAATPEAHAPGARVHSRGGGGARVRRWAFCEGVKANPFLGEPAVKVARGARAAQILPPTQSAPAPLHALVCLRIHRLGCASEGDVSAVRAVHHAVRARCIRFPRARTTFSFPLCCFLHLTTICPVGGDPSDQRYLIGEEDGVEASVVVCLPLRPPRPCHPEKM